MSQARFIRRSLVLCMLAIAPLAIGVNAAQAEVGAFWLVSGKKISTELLPSVDATLENSDVTLLYKLSNRTIHFLCSAIVLEGAHLVEPNGGGLGKAEFSGCTFNEVVNGVLKHIAPCDPKNGVILTNNVKSLITLHGGEGRITLVPAEGTAFVKPFMGEECAFGESIMIGGTLVLKDCNKAFLTDTVTHLYEEDKVLTKLWVNSVLNPATIDGSALAFLIGTHAGLTWAGHPA